MVNHLIQENYVEQFIYYSYPFTYMFGYDKFPAWTVSTGWMSFTNHYHQHHPPFCHRCTTEPMLNISSSLQKSLSLVLSWLHAIIYQYRYNTLLTRGHPHTRILQADQRRILKRNDNVGCWWVVFLHHSELSLGWWDKPFGHHRCGKSDGMWRGHPHPLALVLCSPRWFSCECRGSNRTWSRYRYLHPTPFFVRPRFVIRRFNHSTALWW